MCKNFRLRLINVCFHMKSVKHLHPDALEEVEHLVSGQAAKIKYEANANGKETLTTKQPSL